MKFIPVKTRIFLPPKDKQDDLLGHLPQLKEGDIVFITSKVLGITEGRCIKVKDDTLQEKVKLANREANYFIKKPRKSGSYSLITINQGLLIFNSGIDRSNGNGYYILWPKKPVSSAKNIWKYLRKKNQINKLGVIITDSHSMPLRYGTLGISIGHYGIEPLEDMRGTPDLFGHKLRITRMNIVDSLAATSNLYMGEGADGVPLLILRGFKRVKFTNKDTSKKLRVAKTVDIYSPLLKDFKKNNTKK